jgi:Tol biopolymer transport system component
MGGAQQTLTLIVDPRGQADTLRLPPENRRVTRFSPDGRRIAYEQTAEGGRHDLYTFDLITGASQQLTFEGDNDDPVWSPDGSRILFTSSRPGSDGDDIMIKPADNSAPEAYVFTRPANQWAVAWPRDDQIVFVSNESGNADLYTYSLTDSGSARPYLEAPWNETDLALSPDGALAAVETAEVPPTGIWLRDFPEPIGKWRVSFGGGRDPRWSPDGRTLYYLWGLGAADSIFAVTVDRSAGVTVRDRRLVWAGDLVRWDLHPDGERVLVVQPQGGAEETDVATDRYLVVLNWFEELKQRMGN